MNKKILIGAGIVTLLIIIGGIFWVYQQGEESGGGIRNIFPFGQGDNTPNIFPVNPVTSDIQTDNVQPTVSMQEGMILISKNAVAGGAFLPQGDSTVVRFMERATGHIFDANLRTQEITRISNTTLPKIERVFWTPSRETLVAQFLDAESATIQTKTLELSATSTESGFRRVDEFFLPQGIVELALSPQGEVFYLARGQVGIDGFHAKIRGEDPSLLWQFPTTEWLPEWKLGTIISLTSKASNGVPGLMYLLNTQSGATTPLLSGVSGLTTIMSPNGNMVVYSESKGASLGTRMLYRTDNVDVQLAINTLPEKCVWTENSQTLFCAEPSFLGGSLPDDWYQGKVSFNDSLWRFDVANVEWEMVSPLSTPDGGVDVINPAISSDGNYFLFVNKKDLSLWAVPLASNTESSTPEQ